jgi:hypothetical protein
MILNDVKIMILDEMTVDYFSHFLKQAKGKKNKPYVTGRTSKVKCNPEMSLNHRHHWKHDNEPLDSIQVGQNILRNYRLYAASMDFFS